MVNRVARDDGDAADYARNPRGRKQMLRDSGLTRECERNEDVFTVVLLLLCLQRQEKESASNLFRIEFTRQSKIATRQLRRSETVSDTHLCSNVDYQFTRIFARPGGNEDKICPREAI